MAGFRPYAPLNVPKPFGDNIWIVDGPEIRMDYGPASIPFPTRMTLVRVGDGRLWVHSPVAPDAALFDAVDGLGEVAWLVAPNSLHYWFVADWQQRYPQAKTAAVPGAGMVERANVQHRRHHAQKVRRRTGEKRERARQSCSMPSPTISSQSCLRFS